MFIVNKMATLKGNTNRKSQKKKKKPTKNVVNINLSVEEI